MSPALTTLLELAQRQRDEALSVLLRAEEAVRRLRLQSEQLVAYRDDYRGRNPAMGGRSAPIELLRSHEAFMTRLHQAMAQQQLQLQNAEARTGEARAALLALETRVASVRKLLERREADQRLLSARQDQRRSDDAANMGAGNAWRTGSAMQPLSH
jgi:flagellar FliJ protein